MKGIVKTPAKAEGVPATVFSSPGEGRPTKGKGGRALDSLCSEEKVRTKTAKTQQDAGVKCQNSRKIRDVR